MCNYFFRIIIIQILIIGTCHIFFSGCGKKASPKPPHQGELPIPIVEDLSYSLEVDKLKLTWTVKGKSGLGGFYVFRYKKLLSESDCINCPIMFKQVADIPLKDMVSSGKDSINYFAALESGYRYIYKVVIYTNNGLTGKDSNIIDFNYSLSDK